MSPSPREKIEILREHVRESPDVADADADRLLEFSDLLDGDKSDRRHEEFLRYCAVLAEECDDGLLAASLEDREATEAILDWVFDEVGNAETNRNFRVALRVFAKYLSDGPKDECPPSVDWVPTATEPDYDSRNPGHVI